MTGTQLTKAGTLGVRKHPQSAPWPLERLARPVRSPRGEVIDWTSPVDRSRWFLCETLTPLYYTRVYDELDDEHRRRYNQLTGMFANELIGFLEHEILQPVLTALLRQKLPPMTDALRESLRRFRDEERRHVGIWARLNRLSEPVWYCQRERNILRVTPAVLALLRSISAHPTAFPIVFWIQLAQEERSVEIARRCSLVPANRIEPRYAAVYREHLRDELRHVQLDWHLIERYFEARRRVTRWVNATAFRWLIGAFFLTPAASTTRIIDRLLVEHPELMPIRQRLVTELRGLGDNEAYHGMMYSRPTTPITFGLFDRCPEFHQMRRLLRAYEPLATGAGT